MPFKDQFCVKIEKNINCVEVAIVRFEPLITVDVGKGDKKKFLEHKALKVKDLLSKLIQDFEPFFGNGVAHVNEVIDEVADFQSGFCVERGMKLGDVAEKGPYEGGFIFDEEVSVDLLGKGGREIVHEGLQYDMRHEAIADEAWQVKGELHDLDAITAGSGRDGGDKLMLGE